MTKSLLALVVSVALVGVGPPAIAGAQRPSLRLVPELSSGWGQTIYSDLIATPAGVYEEGRVELEKITRPGLRLEVASPSGVWAAHTSFAFGQARLVSEGRTREIASFRSELEAETAVITLGVSRRLTARLRAPRLRQLDVRADASVMMLHIDAPADPPPRPFPAGPLLPLPNLMVREYLSPGVQLGLGLVQPIVSRVSIRIRGAYGVVRHDTERLDGGYRTYEDSGESRRARWARGSEVGLGIEVRL